MAVKIELEFNVNSLMFNLKNIIKHHCDFQCEAKCFDEMWAKSEKDIIAEIESNIRYYTSIKGYIDEDDIDPVLPI